MKQQYVKVEDKIAIMVQIPLCIDQKANSLELEEKHYLEAWAHSADFFDYIGTTKAMIKQFDFLASRKTEFIKCTVKNKAWIAFIKENTDYLDPQRKQLRALKYSEHIIFIAEYKEALRKE